MQRGFVLLAMLWVLVGVAAIALAVSLAAREALATARNRVDLMRATWMAEGCVEHIRALVHNELIPVSGSGWGRLDRLEGFGGVTAAGTCDSSISPAGAILDVNTAPPEQLAGLFRAVGAPPARADSLADAVLDWRDTDRIPRRFGAEADWYLGAGRVAPRNAAIVDVRELRRIKGFEELIDIGSVLGVEPGRISLQHARPEVLASLPGFGEEAAFRIVEARRVRSDVVTIENILDQLSTHARVSLLQRYADLMRSVAPEPEAWIVKSRASIGTPPITAVVEVRLERASDGTTTARRRTWIE